MAQIIREPQICEDCKGDGEIWQCLKKDLTKYKRCKCVPCKGTGKILKVTIVQYIPFTTNAKELYAACEKALDQFDRFIPENKK